MILCQSYISKLNVFVLTSVYPPFQFHILDQVILC
jgi:hypothetical protein